MSPVIKATDRNRGIHTVAFNFDDVAERAKSYLNEVRQQAGRILVEAATDAQAIRDKAVVEGLRAGHQQASVAIDQKVAQQMQTLMPALQSAIEQIQQSKDGWIAHWERRAVHLAAAMAERVVRRQLQFTPEVTVQLVKEALQLAAGNPEIRVLIHPKDHEALGNQIENLVAEFSRLAPAEVVADPAVSPGGCRVETRYGVIDQQFEQQLARIEEELS